MEETLKILVVDDDEVDRIAVRRWLKAAGLRIEVSEATDCATAKALLAVGKPEDSSSLRSLPHPSPELTSVQETRVSVLSAQTFDCAFLDYRLPDGDGLDLVQAIREAGIKIPLIVLTGQGDEQIAVALMKAGASDYIAKGKLSPDNLTRSLQNALRIHRAEADAASANQKLKESEERYRLVLEGANDGIWDWDLTKNEVYWNDRLLEIVGLSRSEFGSAIEAFYDRLHPDDACQIRQALEAHLAQGVEYNVEFRLLHSSGTYRYCTGRGKAQRNRQGKAVRMAGIISDITDRKQAEAALERERQQLRQIIACVPVAMAMFDTQMRYIAHSQKWLLDYGLEGRAILGLCHYEVLPDIPERWKDIHQRGLQGHVSSASEDIWERADGSVVFQRWAIHPWYRPDGEVGGIVLVTDAINELVQAREAALEASRIKLQFLANMSHEIRTPMNGVLGMSQLLLHTPLESKQHDYAQAIYRSAEHLLSVINDILDFSKIEAGEMRLERVAFDLDGCLESMVDMVAAQAEEKGLELTLLVDSSVPRQLRGDPGRLKQILLNLVGNAIKFTDRGQVLVRVSRSNRARPGDDRPSGLESEEIANLLFSVRDTGIGISPEGQKKLFQSFSQVDASSTRLYGGTGLGLVICKQLVEMMGGEIGVRSSLQEGSTFWFTLPLEKQPFAEPSFPELVGLKLLVVASSALMRAAVRTWTASWGVQCDEAEEVAAAWTRLQERLASDSQDLGESRRNYDIVVLDLQLPDLDATAFYDEVRSLPQPPQVIALTSLKDQPKAEALCQQGVASYLIKPARALRLRDSLVRAIAETETQTTPHSQNTATNTSPDISLHRSVAPHLQLPFKILLVEDHPINQAVILNQLMVLGYQADCASNGKEGLDLLLDKHYDLVFMDCQMPVLDGYAATLKLRKKEAELGRNERRTIVIALTAHAMPGEREKCLAAGMDDYLSKPVGLETLAAILRKYGANNQPVSKSFKEPKELLKNDLTVKKIRAEEDSIVVENFDISFRSFNEIMQGVDPELDSFLDRKRLQEMAQVNIALPQRILQAFIESSQTDLAVLEAALKAQDWNTLEQQAHRLKGTSANVGIRSVSDLATQLESQARWCQAQKAPLHLQAIERIEELLVSLSRLLSQIRELLQSRISTKIKNY